MKRHIARTLTILGAALPLAVTAATLGPPAAHAAADAATFSGAFTSNCSLPTTPDGQAAAGPYSCDHTATSIFCGAVVDSGSGAGAYASYCQANLTSGQTSGYAVPYDRSFASWKCQTGHGTGTFTYAPRSGSGGDGPFTFGVSLDVDPSSEVVNIFGYYVQAGTGRTIVVRASIPALCTWQTNLPTGYQGNISPV